jgi:GT2 family glycosyltransferase
MKKKYTFVIVLYHNEDSIFKLVSDLTESVFQEFISQIILIDNGINRSFKTLNGLDKRICYYRSPLNIGFGAACNFGVKMSDDEDVILLNPDCGINDFYFFKEFLVNNSHDVSYIGSIEKGKKWSNLKRIPHIYNLFNLRGSSNIFDFDSFYFDGSFLSIKKHVFLSQGGFNDLFLYGEDLFFFESIKDKFNIGLYGLGDTFFHNRGSSSSSKHQYLSHKIFAEFYFNNKFSKYNFFFYFFRSVQVFLILLRDLFLFKINMLVFLFEVYKLFYLNLTLVINHYPRNYFQKVNI